MDKEQIEEFNKALHKKDRNWKNLGVTGYTPIGYATYLASIVEKLSNKVEELNKKLDKIQNSNVRQNVFLPESKSVIFLDMISIIKNDTNTAGTSRYVIYQKDDNRVYITELDLDVLLKV